MSNEIGAVTDRVVQRYLSLARREKWETLGEAQRVWADVSRPLADAVIKEALKGDTLTAAVISYVDYSDFRAMVWNRIVSIHLPQSVFETLIEISTEGATLGWSYAQIARRITVELGWGVDVGYWDEQRAIAEVAIEKRLAQVSPDSRDYARLNDPVIAAYQRDMAKATKEADRLYSKWQMQAERISRTETASAVNYEALRQLEREGWTHKQWVAGLDGRTRHSHREADGQVVPINDFFTVGGYSMSGPGDYAAPAEEIINCRCTVVGTMGDRLIR